MKKKIIMILILFIMIISLSSCNGGITYSHGYFKYKINNESNEIMLVGLTKKGQEQETLVIPSEIKGKKVYRIGYPVWKYPGSYHWKCDFKSDKLKNLYFPSSISFSDFSGGFYGELTDIKYIYWGKRNSSTIGIESAPKDGNVYVSTTCYIFNEFSDNHYNIHGELIDNSYIKIANVVYYLNDTTEDTFFVDDCDGTIVNVTPPNPIREGYKFNGWYKEKECINKWDFEKDIIPSKEYDADGNYIFKETSLYACWEKE